jgi:CRP-like cAMP-binding protein
MRQGHGRKLAAAERREALGKVTLFERCSGRELAKIAALTTERTVDSGTELCREGSIGTEFYVVVEGTATVVQRGEVIRRIHAGGSFGETALLDARVRTATVRSATPMRLLVLNPREFGDLLVQAPPVARKLLGVLAARVRLAEDRIAVLEQRVARSRAAIRELREEAKESWKH